MAVEPGQYTTVRGLGGHDLIRLVATPMDEWRNVGVDAGPGDDTLFGQMGDDSLLGGTGRDKAVGKDGRDRCSAEVRRTCESR